MNRAYIIYAWSDKAFKNTVVNQALLSLQGGSLEITLAALLMIISLNQL